MEWIMEQLDTTLNIDNPYFSKCKNDCINLLFPSIMGSRRCIMTEQIISEVLHHILDFEPEQANKVKTALYIVLNKYDIAPKSTED